MFKLTPNPTFKAAVQITVAGQPAPVAIEVEFRHLTRTQIKEFFAGLAGKQDAEALAEIVTGWSGVDVPFSRESLAELLDNYPPSAAELFEAFRKNALESRAKN